jgi:putative transposase
MNGSRITEEQIIAIVSEQKTADICRKHGISSSAFHAWKTKYDGLDVSQARKLKVLEGVNVRLKKLFADSMVDNGVLDEVGAINW